MNYRKYRKRYILIFTALAAWITAAMLIIFFSPIYDKAEYYSERYHYETITCKIVKTNGHNWFVIKNNVFPYNNLFIIEEHNQKIADENGFQDIPIGITVYIISAASNMEYASPVISIWTDEKVYLDVETGLVNQTAPYKYIIFIYIAGIPSSGIAYILSLIGYIILERLAEKSTEKYFMHLCPYFQKKNE